MVTQKEIIDKCQRDIKDLQAKKAELEAIHSQSQYKEEDEAEAQREAEYSRLWSERERLLDTKFLGNWGSRDDWYLGRIPSHIKYIEEDKAEVKAALTLLCDAKRNKIEASEEFKAIEAKLNDSKCLLSVMHIEIHDKLRKINGDIEWNINRIAFVKTKAGMIKIGKKMAEKNKFDTEQAAFKKKVAEYIAQIQSSEAV